MRAVILAAGYGTRLQCDLQNSASHAHLVGVAKPLLPLDGATGGEVLLDRWLSALQRVDCCSEVVVVVSRAGQEQFSRWLSGVGGGVSGGGGNDAAIGGGEGIGGPASGRGAPSPAAAAAGGAAASGGASSAAGGGGASPAAGGGGGGGGGRWRVPVRLVVDEASVDEHTRSGAIACMCLGVGSNLDEDTLFIGGDTLFGGDFCLADFLHTAEQRRRGEPVSAHVLAAPCTTEHVQRRGIIETDSSGERVVGFLEKPSPAATASRLQCPCFYLLTSGCLPLLASYMTSHTELAQRDATGLLVAYLARQCAVFVYNVSRRYDVGSLDTYIECCRNLGNYNSTAIN